MAKSNLKVVAGSPAESSKQERQVIISPPRFEVAAVKLGWGLFNVEGA